MKKISKAESVKMNSHSPAAPIELNGFGQYAPECFMGLTKREMIAMHSMASWINHHGSAGNYSFNAKDAAVSAVECADALLGELNK